MTMKDYGTLRYGTVPYCLYTVRYLGIGTVFIYYKYTLILKLGAVLKL